MKFRCPHCQELFASWEKGHCPKCHKSLRHPEKWQPPKPKPGARRESLQQRLPSSQELKRPIWTIFATSPRFLVWVLGGCMLVGGVVLMSDKSVTKPYQPPTLQTRTTKELMVIRTALEWFRVHCNRYPTTEESLKALVRNPGVEGWKGHYLNGLPPDLWGHPYLYSSSNDIIRLASSGPDGLPDTADDITAPPPDYKALMKRLAMDHPSGKPPPKPPALKQE